MDIFSNHTGRRAAGLKHALRASAVSALLLGAGLAAAQSTPQAMPQAAVQGAPQLKPQVKQLEAGAPQSVLYVGNSFYYFNNGIIAHLNPMIAEGHRGQPYRGVMVAISGAGLDWHDVDSYFRPQGLAKYSFTRDNELVMSPPGGKLFDTAVMVDCSQCPVHPTLKGVFHEYAKKHSDTVRKHGAQPVLFMSWAYQDKPEMTQELAQAYTEAGNANRALVIPVGLAFARSLELRPDVAVHHTDKRHPSLQGSYLAAATTYAALFNKSPVGLGYTAGLPADVARHLQQVAWDSTQAYLGR